MCSSCFSQILFVFLPLKIKELCPLVGGLVNKNTRIQRSMVWPTISKTMRHWLWVCKDGNKDKRLKLHTLSKFGHLLGCQRIWFKKCFWKSIAEVYRFIFFFLWDGETVRFILNERNFKLSRYVLHFNCTLLPSSGISIEEISGKIGCQRLSAC